MILKNLKTSPTKVKNSQESISRICRSLRVIRLRKALSRVLPVFIISAGTLGAATVHRGILRALNGPVDLDGVGLIVAASAYDGAAGSSTDNTRVTAGIDFGDTYLPVNPSFTGGLFGNANGTSSFTPNFGDVELNEVMRTQTYGAGLGIYLDLPPGEYKIQLLFWEPYYGLQVPGGVGSRVFNFAIEGQASVTGLDLIAEHGLGSLNKGVIFSQVVSVTDGTLNIDFTGTTDFPVFSAVIVSSASTSVAGPQDIIGTDDFTGANGPIAGRTGGEFFDFDNSTADDAFIGHEGPNSDWNNVTAAPSIIQGKLITGNSSAKREYNGTNEARGAISPAADRSAKTVYYKFRMRRSSGVTWSGLSSYDSSTERILFGVPDTANPASGNRELGIHVLNSPGLDGRSFSGIRPTTDENTMLVAKIDYVSNRLSLWREPDLTKPELSQTPIVTRSYSTTSPSSALRLGSAGTGNTTWDDLVVSTTWTGLTRNGTFPVPDSFTMNPGDKAVLPVLRNDFGNTAPTSITIVNPPQFGTASVLPDGTIRYIHTTGNPTTDTFTYTSMGLDGSLSKPTLVTVVFTAAARFPTNYVSLPGEAPPTSFALVDAFPGITFTSPHDFASSGNSLYVTEGIGRIWLIPDVTAVVPIKVLFLDISDRVNFDSNELGLKGLTFHPNFAENGRFFVTYNHTSGGNRYSRLSSFQRSLANPEVGDASSETILINQFDEGVYHNVSTCRFGPDGYLYVGFGDEGTQEDGFGNSQRIDKDLWSSLIRIDVDKRTGNLPPNIDSDIPGSGTAGVGFLVPKNNPYTDTAGFNGRPLVQSNVRTEIFATGFRNPWQFSFDPVTRELWLADVGRNDREEINVLQPGDNCGWAWQEGTQNGPRFGQTINGASQSSAILKAPVYDYGRGGGALQGQAAIGGFVYRGTKIPSLVGKYIFGDYVSGNIWSFERGSPNSIERIATESSIVAYTPDPSNGDVLMLDRGNNGTNPGTGRILRLLQTANDSTFPPTLASTGFFADIDDLTPNPGAHFYDVNLRFWSDNSDKSRWFLINNSTDLLGYSRDDPWTFPTGMVWVKHFDLELTPGNASSKRRIETRFMVKTSTGAYGVTYKWNNITNSQPQTEATLVGANGEDLYLPSQVWHLPGRGECMTCHTPNAGHSLSFNTRQLNRSGSLNGQADNFLTLLDNNNYLNLSPGPPDDLPRHLRPNETAYSLEARVRSYLDVNCSYCHRANGTGGGNWDGRHQISIDQTGIIDTPSVDAPLHSGDLLVIPGNVSGSILYSRTAAANGYSRMPPLSTNQVDTEGVQLLSEWINNEADSLTSYEKWRISKFGLNNPLGDPSLDFDGDGQSNYQEYLFFGDPRNAADLLQPVISTISGQVSIPLPALPGRSVTVEHSTNLINWEKWNIPRNDGIPRKPTTQEILSAPMNGPHGFFRYNVNRK